MAPLDNTMITRSLSDDASRVLRVIVRQSVGSTNDEIRALADADSFHGSVVLAEEQTQGRGRRGRMWHSPAIANVYCSMGWQFSHSTPHLSGLSLAVGAIVADMLTSEYKVDAQLKWPNDIFFSGRKLGGILIEICGSNKGRQQVVIGLGLNIDMPEQANSAINRPWTDLREILGRGVDRNELVAALLTELAAGMARFGDGGLAPWLNAWRQRDFLKGRAVVVDGTPPVSGIAAGIDDSGALIVETEVGPQSVAGGEASLLEIGSLR